MIELITGYLFGTLCRGIVIVSGLALLERLGGIGLWHSRWRSLLYWALLLLVLLPIGGMDYSGFFRSRAAKPPSSLHPAPSSFPAAAPAPAVMQQPQFFETTPAAPAPPAMPAVTPTAAPASPSWFESGMTVWQDGILQPILFALWCLGAAIALAARFRRHRNWRRRMQALPELRHPRLEALFRRVEERAGFPAGRVKLYDCGGVIAMPCCCGVRRPAVLFPGQLAAKCKDAELEMLFLHELQHLKRRDTLLLELESILSALFFFNPCLNYLFRRLNQAGELACDQAVIETMEAVPEKQLAYGRLLLSLASGAPAAARPLPPVPGLADGKKELKLRLQILSTPYERRKAMRKTLSVFGVIALLGTGCMLLPSCAEKTDAKTTAEVEAPAFPVTEGSFTFTLTIPSSNAQQEARTETYEVRYLTCLDADGKPAKGAENVVAYIPWLGENNPFGDAVNRYYAEKLGYTVFAIPDPGYPPLEVWIAAQDELTRRLGLEPRKLLLYGASSGATNALNASARFPDRIDAIAAHSPRRWYGVNDNCHMENPDALPSIFTRQDQVGRLLTNNWYDPAREGIEQIIADLKSQGMPPLSLQIPSNPALVDNVFYHRGPSPFSHELFHRYFADIVALRDANNGVLPPETDWPVTLETAAGTLRFPGPRSAEHCRNVPQSAHDLRYNAGAAIELQSASGAPEVAALLLVSKDFPSQMRLWDYAWTLTERGKVHAFATEVTPNAEENRLLFQRMLKAAQETGLPVRVIALGEVAKTVLANLPQKAGNGIDKVTIAGIPWKGQKAPAGVPVVMVFDVTTASEPAPDSGVTGVNTGAPADFGNQLPGIVAAAAAPDMPSPRPMNAPRLVNDLPEKLAALEALQAVIPPEDGIAEAQAYVAANKALRSHLRELHRYGILSPDEYYLQDLELLAGQAKYVSRNASGPSTEETLAVTQALLKELQTQFRAYGEFLQSRTNAGADPMRVEPQFRKYFDRYKEVTAILMQAMNTNEPITLPGSTSIIMPEQQKNLQYQRQQARARGAADQQRYSAEQLQTMEKIYQQANANLSAPEAPELLRQVIAACPDSNRAGCATMYLAQITEGDEQLEYLQSAIDKYSDCFYYDGTQVGPKARQYLFVRYSRDGDKAKAQALLEEIRTQFPDAVSHNGKRLAELLPAKVD